jgi:MOSC domain-containing protein YiiM
MMTLAELTGTFPRQGVVQWIGLRPQRRAPMQSLNAIELSKETGILGDRYARAGGKRQVTLLQYEHLAVIASLLGTDEVAPAMLRRNLAIKGINLLALKGHRFTLGTATLEFTGLCHPCSQMEQIFGAGGYNALRGHGGITARVVADGRVALGDGLIAIAD